MTAQFLGEPTLPPARGVGEGASRFLDGGLWIIRQGQWVPIADPEGGTVALPDIPVEPPRPPDDYLPPLTYSILLGYQRSSSARSTLLPISAYQSSTSDNNDPIRPAAGGWIKSGVSGTYPVQLYMTFIYDLPTTTQINIFVRRRRLEGPAAGETRQHALSMRAVAGGIRVESTRNQGSEAYGNEAILDLLVGDLFCFEVDFTPAGASLTADDIPTAFRVYVQLTPMVQKLVSRTDLGNAEIISVDTTFGESWPSGISTSVAAIGSVASCTMQLHAANTISIVDDEPDQPPIATRVTLSKDPSYYAPVALTSTDGGSTWHGELPFPGAGVEPGTAVEWLAIYTVLDENGVGKSLMSGQTTTISAG